MKRLVGSLISAALIYLMVPSHLYAVTTAYIPNEGDDNVKIVEIPDETDPTITTVDVGCAGPYGAAVTPDGNDFVLTCTDDESVSVISTANTSSEENFTITDAQDIRGVAIESREIYAYVADYAADKVYRVTLSSGSVVSYDVGEGPWGVAAIYDSVAASVKVYVSNHDTTGGSISVIGDSVVEDTITDVGNGPLGVALTPDGKFLYVAINGDNKVKVFDTSDNSLNATIDVGLGPWGVAMADDGAHVFVTNSGTNSVTVINTSTKTPATYNIATGVQPMGVAAPVNGEFAYVVNNDITGGEFGIYKITTSGGITSVGVTGELNGAVALGAFFGDSRPSDPTSLEATVTGSDITLTWNDNATDELGYKIERREDGQDAYTQIVKVGENVTEYTDRNLDGGTIYFYKVRAYKEASDSGYSSTTNATAGDESFSWCFINSLFN